MVLVIMGVSGSGKTTVGKLLAETLDWAFREGDDDHPAANIAKMARGEPLDDEDRRPWLESVRGRVADALAGGTDLVLTCSALKGAYRQILQLDPVQVRFVYLETSPALAAERLRTRAGHFMKASMVGSQFSALEEPSAAEALILNAADTPAALVESIRRALLAPHPPH
jgi:gluconokinase